MNQREKILAAAVGGILAIFVLGFGIRGFISKPVQEVDKRIAGVRAKLDSINSERRAYFADEEKVKAVARRMFADRVENASALSGEMLTRHILRSGLKESEFTRLPVGPRKMRGALEVGWNVQGDGPLSDVVDLIFKLKNAPQISRIDGLTVSSGDKPGLVRVRFRYLTIVVDPAPACDPADLTAEVSLEGPERRVYDDLVSRDLLRPYIRREAEPRPLRGTAVAASKEPKPAPGPESFRVVSLSEWQGQPEVHVRDLTNEKTFRYKPGDFLAGGTVVMIDYRSMPMPGREVVQSESRVILRFGQEYYAIDRGQTLADKHLLKTEQLPEELAKLMPAAQAPTPEPSSPLTPP